MDHTPWRPRCHAPFSLSLSMQHSMKKNDLRTSSPVMTNYWKHYATSGVLLVHPLRFVHPGHSGQLQGWPTFQDLPLRFWPTDDLNWINGRFWKCWPKRGWSWKGSGLHTTVLRVQDTHVEMIPGIDLSDIVRQNPNRRWCNSDTAHNCIKLVVWSIQRVASIFIEFSDSCFFVDRIQLTACVCKLERLCSKSVHPKESGKAAQCFIPSDG